MILITGGVEEDTGRYWRRHAITPRGGGGWYYCVYDTPQAATRLILYAVAPTSIGPLDWTERRLDAPRTLPCQWPA